MSAAPALAPHLLVAARRLRLQEAPAAGSVSTEHRLALIDGPVLACRLHCSCGDFVTAGPARFDLALKRLRRHQRIEATR